MELRNLGASAIKVSPVCLGTMSFGWTSGQETAYQMLDSFVHQGGNFIDTADIYAEGAAESILGSWLRRQRRHELVIATKVRFATGPGPDNVGLGRRHIIDAVDASLRRLQTEYIDLYQLHCWDEATPLDETLLAMADLVQAGKVRAVGVSNVTGWQLQAAIDSCRRLSLPPLVSLQALYNLLDRYLEWDLLPVCRQAGLALLCWSPLAGGWLTGRITPQTEAPPKEGRFAEAEEKGWSEAWRHYDEPRTWSLLETFLSLAQELGRPPAQVALNWLRQRPGVTCPILGAETMAEFDQNMGAFSWSLDQESLQLLERASLQPPPRYPYGFIARFNPQFAADVGLEAG